MFKTLCLIALIFFSVNGMAEPWLSSRFAQNCASCHAPGRVNVQASRRRCTLSCQGCHTSPSGGGLRNFYGKWNEQRWLRSMYFSDYRFNKPRPAPTDQQYYGERRIKSVLANVKEKDMEKVERQGFNLVETGEMLPEKDYDRRTTGEKVVMNPSEAHLRIPKDDPWRLTREEPLTGGVDLRWFVLDNNIDGVHKKGTQAMATDVAVAAHPMQKLSLVWEGRFLNDPRSSSVWDQGYTKESMAKSAYALVDDLPYNSYVQYGIYRPLFGHYNPDHTTLFSRATGLDQRAAYKTASIGTAPGVPFFNLHVIQPFADRTLAQDRGVAFNAGARFVTLGAYVMYSYWKTNVHDWTADTNTVRKMESLTGGFTKGRFTFVFDVTEIARDVDNGASDSGSVITIEPHLRLWRETYLKGSYEYLNTAPDLKLGNSKQWSAGLGSFLVSGLEMEVMYQELRSSEATVNSKEQNIWGQLHLYF